MLEPRRLLTIFSGYVEDSATGKHLADIPVHDWYAYDPGTLIGATIDTTTNGNGYYQFDVPTGLPNFQSHDISVRPGSGWTVSGTDYYDLPPAGPGSDFVLIKNSGSDLPTDSGDCNCECKDCLKLSTHPVRYGDGQVAETTTDLGSNESGTPWGQTRDWSNSPGYAQNNRNGNGWVDPQWPTLVQPAGGGSVAVLQSGHVAEWFDAAGGDSYTSRHGSLDTLSYLSASGEFVFTGSDGTQVRYHDFSGTLPAFEQGLFESYRDPAGNLISAQSYDSSGDITDVRRSITAGGVTTTESYLYTYYSSGASSGLLQNVQLRRSTNGGSTWAVVREVAYTYYDGSYSGDNAYGNTGDLRTAVVEDGSGNAIGTTYYRYYILNDADTTGYVGGLKYVVEPDAYARLAAALPGGTTPLTATNAQLSPYATRRYEYDSDQRVIREDVAGAGTNLGPGNGIGTITYAYTLSSNGPYANSWAMKTVETLADGNQNIVYTNYLTDVMLKVFKNTTTGQEWPTFYHYNDNAQVDLMAGPSAFQPDASGNLYNDNYSDLLQLGGSGDYQYLSNTSGAIQTYNYFSGTPTATSTTAGDVDAKLKDTYVQQGDQGTPIQTGETQYYLQTYTPSGSGAVTSVTTPVASQTVYRNADGTGAQTTGYSYTWLLDSGSNPTNQPQSITTTLPAVTSGENGSGTADASTAVLDAYGHLIWSKDAGGFIDYFAYDPATGALVKEITDVNTADTSDFTNLPSGWSTPTGGGLELITALNVDALGRTTKQVTPANRVTYTTYNDANRETRVYPGWNATTGTTTGPIQVSRLFYPVANSGGSVYDETLSTSATPAVSGSAGSYVPTGGETLTSANIQGLTRDLTNAAGQLSETDAYASLSGVTYSQTTTHLGALGANYYARTFGYDNQGNGEKTVSADGTINYTVLDGMGRVTGTWVGTSDTGATAADPTGGGAAGNNMTRTSSELYDQ